MAWRDGYTAASLMCVAAEAAIEACPASDGVPDCSSVSLSCQTSQTHQPPSPHALYPIVPTTIRPESKAATDSRAAGVTNESVPSDKSALSNKSDSSDKSDWANKSDMSDKCNKSGMSDKTKQAAALRQLDMAALMGGPRFRPLVDAAIARLQDDAIAAALSALRKRQKAAVDAAAIPMAAARTAAAVQMNAAVRTTAAVRTAAAVQTATLSQAAVAPRAAATISRTGIHALYSRPLSRWRAKLMCLHLHVYTHSQKHQDLCTLNPRP